MKIITKSYYINLIKDKGPITRHACYFYYLFDEILIIKNISKRYIKIYDRKNNMFIENKSEFDTEIYTKINKHEYCMVIMKGKVFGKNSSNIKPNMIIKY